MLEPRARDLNPAALPPWFNIVPPSGEFRWISGHFVDRDYKTDGLRRTSTAADRSPRWQDQRDEPPVGTFQQQIDETHWKLSARSRRPKLLGLSDFKRLRANALQTARDGIPARPGGRR